MIEPINKGFNLLGKPFNNTTGNSTIDATTLGFQLLGSPWWGIGGGIAPVGGHIKRACGIGRDNIKKIGGISATNVKMVGGVVD